LDEIDDDSVVVVATTTKDRFAILERVMARKPRAIICEKPVAQGSDDYQKLLEIGHRDRIRVFVNFTLRIQPFYQKIKSEINGGTDYADYVFFSNLPRSGLACVGIHHIDLLCWLFGIRQYEFIGSHFLGTYEQKRNGFFDVIGGMHLKTDRNGAGVISNSHSTNVCAVQIILRDVVYNVFEGQRIVTRLNKADTNRVHVETVEYRYVSSYMTDIIESCFSGSYAEAKRLPDLQESLLSHQILFDYLQRHSLLDLNFT